MGGRERERERKADQGFHMRRGEGGKSAADGGGTPKERKVGN